MTLRPLGPRTFTYHTFLSLSTLSLNSLFTLFSSFACLRLFRRNHLNSWALLPSRYFLLYMNHWWHIWIVALFLFRTAEGLGNTCWATVRWGGTATISGIRKAWAAGLEPFLTSFTFICRTLSFLEAFFRIYSRFGWVILTFWWAHLYIVLI